MPSEKIMFHPEPSRMPLSRKAQLLQGSKELRINSLFVAGVDGRFRKQKCQNRNTITFIRTC